MNRFGPRRTTLKREETHLQNYIANARREVCVRRGIWTIKAISKTHKWYDFWFSDSDILLVPINIFVDDLSEKKKRVALGNSGQSWIDLSALDFLGWKLQVSTSNTNEVFPVGSSCSSPIDLSQDLASGSGHDSVAVVVGHSVFIARFQDHPTGRSNMDLKRSCQIWIG